MEADPNPMPEFRLFGSERLRNAADFIGNVVHLVFDQMRSPTPSEHHFETKTKTTLPKADPVVPDIAGRDLLSRGHEEGSYESREG